MNSTYHDIARPIRQIKPAVPLVLYPRHDYAGEHVFPSNDAPPELIPIKTREHILGCLNMNNTNIGDMRFYPLSDAPLSIIDNDSKIQKMIYKTFDTAYNVSKAMKKADTTETDAPVRLRYLQPVLNIYRKRLTTKIQELIIIRRGKSTFNTTELVTQLFIDTLVARSNNGDNALESQLNMLFYVRDFLRMQRLPLHDKNNRIIANLNHVTSVPLVWYIFHINKTPDGKCYMILDVWVRSIEGLAITSNNNEYSVGRIGPLAFSLLVEAASGLVGQPVDYICMHSLHGTDSVLTALSKELEIPLQLYRASTWPINDESVLAGQRDILVVSNELRHYYKRFQQVASEPNAKRACISCGMFCGGC